jgi:hypothetical protein
MHQCIAIGWEQKAMISGRQKIRRFRLKGIVLIPVTPKSEHDPNNPWINHLRGQLLYHWTFESRLEQNLKST